MSIAFISVGSNIGDGVSNCTNAVRALSEREGIGHLKSSSLYFTEPYGDIEQEWFINSVVKIETNLSPLELLYLLHEIEGSFGRKREISGGPRTVDMDLLFYDNLIMRDRGITLPHPHLHARAFVLTPFIEIEPHFIHPVLKRSVEELSRELNDGKKVLMVENFKQPLNF